MKIGIAICLPALLLMALISGCGPGGGIGGTGKAGTIEDGLIVGVVDGFGSIIINDTRFETESASVFVDGVMANLMDIKIGMKVSARVSEVAGSASAIHYQPNVSGPIDSVDLEAGQLQIFGYKVLIGVDTIFDELTPAELTIGTLVEVSGDRNSENEIVARFVSKAANSESIFAVGTVVSADNGTTVLVSGAGIDFSLAAESLGLTEQQFASEYLVPGTLVRISSTDNQDAANGRNGADGADGSNLTSAVPEVTDANVAATAELVISSVRRVEPPAPRANDTVQVLSRISQLEPDRFLLDGLWVTVTDETQVLNLFGLPVDSSQLAEDSVVLVAGTASNDLGEIVATTIILMSLF